MEELEELMGAAGFETVFIKNEEVTDAYALKWEYGLGLKDYIGKALCIGKK
ncbi:MAG: methyltransferase [Tissierellia bacterium]|nr:methyltransferase [Tissierellia bacterium]